MDVVALESRTVAILAQRDPSAVGVGYVIVDVIVVQRERRAAQVDPAAVVGRVAEDVIAIQGDAVAAYQLDPPAAALGCTGRVAEDVIIAQQRPSRVTHIDTAAVGPSPADHVVVDVIALEGHRSADDVDAAAYIGR